MNLTINGCQVFGVDNNEHGLAFLKQSGFTDSDIEGAFLEAEHVEIIRKRKVAYTEESDPLRNEWKYEEETGSPDADQYKQNWLDKVVEIKARYPLPTES